MTITKAQRAVDEAVRDAQFEGRMDNFEFKLDELTTLVKGIASEIKTTQVVQFDVAVLKEWKQRMLDENRGQVSKERFERLESTVYRILWAFGGFVILFICYAIFGKPPGMP